MMTIIGILLCATLGLHAVPGGRPAPAGRLAGFDIAGMQASQSGERRTHLPIPIADAATAADARQAAAPGPMGASRRDYALLFIMAVLLAAAFFNLMLFFGFQGNLAYLFFSLYCLANSFRAGVAPWAVMEGIPPNLPMGEGKFGILMYVVAAISLLAYLVTKFSFHKTHKLLSAILLIASALIPLAGEHPGLELLHFLSFSAFTLVLALAAFFLKKENSLFVLVGIVGYHLMICLGSLGLLPNGYYAGILFLVISISALSAKEIADQHRRERQAEARAVRLENQLLKRQIQPHYILNTLTSLEEVVDRTPARAAEFIQALADEFRLFSQAAGETLIPMADELNLCRAHLRIMEFRRGARFDLHVQGVEGTETIPPGVIHTLVENGTTHGYPGRISGRFQLTKEHTHRGVRYTMFNDSQPGDGGEHPEKGTGRRYVEARLEESYPGAWEFSWRRVAEGWEVAIELPDDRETGG